MRFRDVIFIGGVVWAAMTATGRSAEPPSTAPAEANIESEADLFPETATGSHLSEQEIQALVEELAHPRFSVRREAMQILRELHPRYIDILMRRYHEERDYERKRGLRYVLEYIFHRVQIAGKEGFLGVEVDRAVRPILLDPKTGQAHRGVTITHVKDGFAAKRAGIQDGDVVIRFNGLLVPDHPTVEEFIALVSSHKPGEVIEVRVLRTARTDRSISAENVAEPAKLLEGATLETSQHGLLVTALEPDSPAAKLGIRPQDVIRQIDALSLTGVNPAVLARRLAQAQAGTSFTLKVLDTAEVPVSVTLGSRPVEMLGPNEGNVVQAKFRTWWKARGGDLSDRTVSLYPQLTTYTYRPAIPQPPALPDAHILP